MAVVRKKSDDKYLKALRELITTGGGNRQCFDCGQKGPTYVNMTIGSFVCTRCSGVLRGLTPPHRVKSISMATFTQEELDFLKAHGNDESAKTWLGLWDPKRVKHQDQRELMVDKYERKRYYLEPASPLKSLTTIQNQNQNGNSAATASLTNGYGNINSNNNHDSQPNHQPQKHQDINNLKQIQLTPPNSQRSSSSASSNAVNGMHYKMGAGNSSQYRNGSAVSRPSSLNNHNSQSSHHQDLLGLTLMNGSGLKPPSSVSSASTGALSDTSSCTSNGFGPDSDFVADFNSANIYDATSLNSALTGGSNGQANNPSSRVMNSISANGYAKILPLKMEHNMNGGHHHHHQMNGIAPEMNGNCLQTANMNGNSSATENFADFDHAPIYNAAADNNNSQVEDRYAALKDLDEQLRESKALASAAASIVSSAVVDSFGNPHHQNNNGSPVNPFKILEEQQQQQQQANAGLANPFQAAQQQTTNLFGQMTAIPNGVGMANGFAVQQQQQQPQPQPPQGFFNYSNGYAATTGSNGAGLFVPMSRISPNQIPSANLLSPTNGCGFGFGTIQQQMAVTNGVNGGGAFNNPFAATGGAMNSNNPFL